MVAILLLLAACAGVAASPPGEVSASCQAAEPGRPGGVGEDRGGAEGSDDEAAWLAVRSHKAMGLDRGGHVQPYPGNSVTGQAAAPGSLALLLGNGALNGIVNSLISTLTTAVQEFPETSFKVPGTLGVVTETVTGVSLNLEGLTVDFQPQSDPSEVQLVVSGTNLELIVRGDFSGVKSPVTATAWLDVVAPLITSNGSYQFDADAFSCKSGLTVNYGLDLWGKFTKWFNIYSFTFIEALQLRLPFLVSMLGSTLCETVQNLTLSFGNSALEKLSKPLNILPGVWFNMAAPNNVQQAWPLPFYFSPSGGSMVAVFDAVAAFGDAASDLTAYGEVIALPWNIGPGHQQQQQLLQTMLPVGGDGFGIAATSSVVNSLFWAYQQQQGGVMAPINTGVDAHSLCACSFHLCDVSQPLLLQLGSMTLNITDALTGCGVMSSISVTLFYQKASGSAVDNITVFNGTLSLDLSVHIQLVGNNFTGVLELLSLSLKPDRVCMEAILPIASTAMAAKINDLNDMLASGFSVPRQTICFSEDCHLAWNFGLNGGNVSCNATSSTVAMSLAFELSSFGWSQLWGVGWQSSVSAMVSDWPKGPGSAPLVALGLHDGAVMYFNSTGWTQLQGQSWETYINQISASWAGGDSVPQLVVGLGDGSVQYYDTTTWVQLANTDWKASVDQMSVLWPTDTAAKPQVLVALGDGAVMYYSGTTWSQLQGTGWKSAAYRLAVNWEAVDSSGVPQVVVGLADGSVQYYHIGSWSQLQGTGWGNSVNSMSVSWPSSGGSPQIVVGLGEGSVQFYSSNRDTWVQLCGNQWSSPVSELAVNWAVTAPNGAPLVVAGLEDGSVQYYTRTGNWMQLQGQEWTASVNMLSAFWPCPSGIPEVLVGLSSGAVEFYNGNSWVQLQGTNWESSITQAVATWSGIFPAIVVGLGNGAVMSYATAAGSSTRATSACT